MKIDERFPVSPALVLSHVSPGIWRLNCAQQLQQLYISYEIRWTIRQAKNEMRWNVTTEIK